MDSNKRNKGNKGTDLMMNLLLRVRWCASGVARPVLCGVVLFRRRVWVVVGGEGWKRILQPGKVGRRTTTTRQNLEHGKRGNEGSLKKMIKHLQIFGNSFLMAGAGKGSAGKWLDAQGRVVMFWCPSDGDRIRIDL